MVLHCYRTFTGARVEPLIAFRNKTLHCIDQTKLPGEYHIDTYDDYRAVCAAIKTLKVRGAPAIGVAAAYAVVVAAYQYTDTDITEYRRRIATAADELSQTRPTAVNLFWALNRMRAVLNNGAYRASEEIRAALLAEAESIARDDRALGKRLGETGATLLRDGDTVMTICNAGSLATSGIGSALSCVYSAKDEGKRIRVYALETRPLLQGARLTTFELMHAGVDVTLITDSMASIVMKEKGVTLVIVGADRIAMNGDTANKVGTSGLAIIARHYGVPFYVAAPKSTFDQNAETGSAIPIEERDADELRYFNGKQIAPLDVSVYNPAFDVTDANLIAGIITEEGILRPPFTESIRAFYA